MRRNRNDDADYEYIDGKRILKDGRTYRAGPVTLMDSLQRAVSRNSSPARITTADGRSGIALNKPGFRILAEDDAGAYHRARAYREYETQLCDAWRGPVADLYDPHVDFGERGTVAAKEGRPCTRNGFPGVLRRGSDGEMYCDISKSAGRNDAADARRARKTKYDPRGRLAGTEEMEEEETDDAAAEKERPECAGTAQMMRDHQNKMAHIYDKLDHELSEAWRQS
jgi:hypothetical protein